MTKQVTTGFAALLAALALAPAAAAATPPELSVSPSSLSFTSVAGGDDPVPESLSVSADAAVGLSVRQLRRHDQRSTAGRPTGHRRPFRSR